ncbi:hypothetical protein Plhal304r1_c070g0158801 [Plasmopara halstedii]
MRISPVVLALAAFVIPSGAVSSSITNNDGTRSLRSSNPEPAAIADLVPALQGSDSTKRLLISNDDFDYDDHEERKSWKKRQKKMAKYHKKYMKQYMKQYMKPWKKSKHSHRYWY